MKMNVKKTPVWLMSLILIPTVFAQEESSCGLTNLASCIPEKMYEYTLGIINAPLQPFLLLIKNLLSEPVDISTFLSLWAIVIYIISIFYGFFIILAGFNFIISGYSATKRERAKVWLKEIVLMIVFVQGSYYIYALLIELSASMTSSVVGLIDPDFFLLTIDNLPNLGMQLVLAIPYLITLLVSVLLLALRYLMVAIGVIFFPIGLFFNFVQPLKSYGKLILNVLMIMMFLPFFLSLLLLASAKLVEIPLFANVKILIMTSAFTLVNFVMILMALFAVIKAALSVMKSDIGRAVTTVVTGIPVPSFGSKSADSGQTKLSDF